MGRGASYHGDCLACLKLCATKILDVVVFTIAYITSYIIQSLVIVLPMNIFTHILTDPSITLIWAYTFTLSHILVNSTSTRIHPSSGLGKA